MPTRERLCERCGRSVEIRMNEVGSYPAHVSRFVFHFAVYEPWGEEPNDEGRADFHGR